jgi:metal-dependent amidase/aminoacylase/carboxypeptidase family protein
MSSTNKVSHQDITAAGLSEADQNINNSVEDKSHQAAGHKANLSNPSASLQIQIRNIDTDNMDRHQRRVEEAIGAGAKGVGRRAGFLWKTGKGRVGV